MNKLALNANQRMSSLEIAELTNKNHADVLRDIKNVLEQAEIGESIFACTYLSKQNKKLPCYRLPKRECDLVVSGYSVKYRLKIIDRWRELEEKQQAKALPQTYLEALKALVKSEEQRALDAPKVNFANVLTESSNTRSVRYWVKAMKHENNLTVGEQQVFKFLRENGYIFKSENVPMAKYEANGMNYFRRCKRQRQTLATYHR